MHLHTLARPGRLGSALLLTLAIQTGPLAQALRSEPRTPAPGAQDAQAAAQGGAVGPVLGQKPAPADSKTSIFGEPLYVNGKRISDEDIQLHILYGPARLMLEMYKVGLIVDDQIRRTAIENAEVEIARREAEAPFASPEARAEALKAATELQMSRLKERYTLDEQLFQEEYDETIKEFRENYPVLDVPAEIARAFRSLDWYRTQLRQTLMFDRVFLPANPEEWPIVTLEAVRADSGEILVEDAKTSFQTRTQMMEKHGLKKLPKEDPIYVTMMRQIVRDAMFGLCDFRTQPDAPPGIALWGDADGDGKPEVEVSIAKLWDEVKDTVNQTEIDEAKHWYVTSVATRDRELKEGILLSDQDCRANIDEFVKQFDNTYFSLEILATKTYYFPSVESYKRYHCMFEGFKAMMEPRLESGQGGDVAAPLRAHLDKANRVMGLGQVDAEVMLISALDFPKFQWKEDGWRWAKTKADELRAKITANGEAYAEQRAKELQAKQDGTTYAPENPAVEPYRYWSQMMDDHSEYWDPPPAEKHRTSDVTMKRKGRFGPRYRNDLIGFVGETFYTNWVTGSTITDYVFFDQAEGTVAGPFKGPFGYYLTRVNKRTPPTRPLNLADPKHVQLLKDDYLRAAFIEYAREAVAQATVEGFSGHLR